MPRKAPKALSLLLFILFSFKRRRWCVQIPSHHAPGDCRMCARGKIRVKKFVNNFNGYIPRESEKGREISFIIKCARDEGGGKRREVKGNVELRVGARKMAGIA